MDILGCGAQKLVLDHFSGRFARKQRGLKNVPQTRSMGTVESETTDQDNAWDGVLRWARQARDKS